MDAAQASAHHHPALDKPKTILIADDSAMIRTVIRQAIERDTEFEVCAEASMALTRSQKPKNYHQI